MKKINSLSKVHAIEKSFHDAWARAITDHDVQFKKTFNSVTAIENKYALSFMGNLKGKKILDLGAGMGDATLYFASKGAKVYAIDISPEMMKLVRSLAKNHELQNKITAKTMIAEKLDFPDAYFDIVFGNGILHHVAIKPAISEVHRVLKKDGIAVFVEPLAHNPFINIYRRIANSVRTPTEHPLEYQFLGNLTSKKFAHMEHSEFHLTTLLIFIWYFIFGRVNPNKERYWKKIVNEGSDVAKAFKLLHWLDGFLLARISYLRKYCWNTVLVFRR